MSATNGAGDDQRPRRLGMQPFSRDMVRDHLDRQALKYLVDQDGDFRLDFAPFADGAPEIMVWITAEGANEDILVIRLIAHHSIPKTLWPTAVGVCNRWNQEKRFPKAFLHVPSDVEALMAPIHLEGQLPLGAGCAQPFVDDWLQTMLVTGFSFWQWIAEERLLDEEL